MHFYSDIKSIISSHDVKIISQLLFHLNHINPLLYTFGFLLYSTVTDFARFRGLSTSKPFATLT